MSAKFSNNVKRRPNIMFFLHTERVNLFHILCDNTTSSFLAPMNQMGVFVGTLVLRNKTETNLKGDKVK